MNRRSPTLQAWSVLLVLTGLASLRSLRSVTEWLLTPWAFTYEHGFIKRALVGEIVARVFGPPTVPLIMILSGIMTVTLALALVRWFAEPALREGSLAAWAFAVIAATHSATVPNLFYETGLFDHIGFLILLGCLLVLVRGAPASRTWVVPAACTVGLLVHEGFALWFVPMIFAVWDYEEGRKGRIRRLLLLSGLAGLTWAIGVFGLMRNVPLDEYVAQLQARHAFPIREGNVRVLYSGFMQNVQGTWTTISQDWYLVNGVVMLVTLLPTLVLLWRIVRRLATTGSARGPRIKLVLASALTPLLLSGLGWDLSRWSSITLINLFVAISYLTVREGSIGIVADVVRRSPVICAVALATSLVAGPLGVVQPFPRFEGLWLVSYPLLAWLFPAVGGP